MRTAPLNDPTDLSTILEVYDWDQIESLLVYLDKEIGLWFLYYVDRAATGIHMKTAPAGTDEPPTEFTLTVEKTGSGSGTVSSNPPGIDSGLDCSETLAAPTVIQQTRPRQPVLWLVWSPGLSRRQPNTIDRRHLHCYLRAFPARVPDAHSGARWCGGRICSQYSGWDRLWLRLHRGLCRGRDRPACRESGARFRVRRMDRR